MRTFFGYIRVWFVAARPHTLSASAVPVAVGGALAAGGSLAARQGGFSWGLFSLILSGSLLVQIGANLTDEYADHGTTTSAHKYPAPHKVIARGLLMPGTVRLGAVAVFAVATLIGSYLVFRTGWPLLAVCLVSLTVAFFYSAGPLPLGDIALGEPLVFLVMGPVMVMSTAYVLTLQWDWLNFWYSLPVGGLVTAILVANNLRDAGEDKRHGRRTMVIVFGAPALRMMYRFLVLGSFATPLVSVLAGLSSAWMLLPWLTFPLAFRVFRLLSAGEERATLHRVLKGTSALHLTFGLLLAVALLAEG